SASKLSRLSTALWVQYPRLSTLSPSGPHDCLTSIQGIAGVYIIGRSAEEDDGAPTIIRGSVVIDLLHARLTMARQVKAGLCAHIATTAHYPWRPWPTLHGISTRCCAPPRSRTTPTRSMAFRWRRATTS